MTQRWSLYPDLTLGAGLALWFVAAQGALAEVEALFQDRWGIEL